jgi:hypothetical protein
MVELLPTLCEHLEATSAFFQVWKQIEWMNKWLIDWVFEWFNKCMYVWMCERVSEWLNKRKNDWLSDLINVCMYECVRE